MTVTRALNAPHKVAEVHAYARGGDRARPRLHPGSHRTRTHAPAHRTRGRRRSAAHELADRRDRPGPERRGRAQRIPASRRRHGILGRRGKRRWSAPSCRAASTPSTSPASSHTAATVGMLRQSRIPCVEGGNLARNPIDMAVGYSSKDAAKTVTRYLIDRGYRPLGYIGAWPKDNDRARDRRRGFAAACKSAGIVVDDGMCIETDLDLHAGARAMGTLLDRHPEVRAVFCSADTLAVGAMFEAQRRRIAIPGRSRDRRIRRPRHRIGSRARADDASRPALRDRPTGGRDDLRAPGRAHASRRRSSTSATSSSRARRRDSIASHDRLWGPTIWSTRTVSGGVSFGASRHGRSS